MARRGFRIHSSARFNPFSYQELLAPIQEYQTAHNQMQDSLLALGEEANQYRQLIDNDQYASDILKGYNDTLANISDALSAQGLRTVNRNTLLNLRRDYNNKVKPVNDAAKTLSSLQQMYQQAFAKDPKLMRGAMPTIQELVQNPAAMPHMVSGEDLYKQGTQAAAASSARIFNSSFGDRANGYIKQVQEQGYRPEIVEAFLNDASKVPELANDIQRIRDMYNTSKLEDQGRQADKYIMQGILDGIGYSRKESMVDDWQSRMSAQYNKQLELAKEKHRMAMEEIQEKAKGKGSGSGTGYSNQGKDILVFQNGKLAGQYSSADKLSSDGKAFADRTTNQVTVDKLDLDDKATALTNIHISIPDEWRDQNGSINGDLVVGQYKDKDGNEQDLTVKDYIDTLIDNNIDELNMYNYFRSEEMSRKDFKERKREGLDSGRYGKSGYKGDHLLRIDPVAVRRDANGDWGDELQQLMALWASAEGGSSDDYDENAIE